MTRMTRMTRMARTARMEKQMTNLNVVHEPYWDNIMGGYRVQLSDRVTGTILHTTACRATQAAAEALAWEWLRIHARPAEAGDE